MKIFGFAAWSGGGKTTLIERVIPQMTARGLTVSMVKHAHHDFDIDHPGKDSWRHRQAGAREVVISSGRRWAMMHELQGEAEPSLDELVSRMSPCDLLLVEGFRRYPHPKIEVFRAANGRPALHPDDPWIVALATDQAFDSPLPQFALDDAPGVARYILRHTGLDQGSD
jgi:molybdopterin-guanine dinucleotide biosynthesis protein B